MCNLYAHTKGPKATRDLANAMGGDWHDSVRNLEPQPAIFPDGVGPVVRKTEAGRDLVKMRWGFPCMGFPVKFQFGMDAILVITHVS
jgi:putative SOS response-associated peptidase YedK